METATQFAWTCIGSPAYPPEKPASDVVCWLCGGPTEGHGWPRKQTLPNTFTNVNIAVAPGSGALCAPCAYFLASDTWAPYAMAHPECGGEAYSKLKDGKKQVPLVWRIYSHVFAAGLHDCPTRARWRQWLLSPPEPPFLFCIAESGQKHVIFRGRVAYSRDAFPVQVEEDSLWIDRARLADCLTDFERAYAAGFSKDSILTGRYHHGQMLKVGLQTWRDLETAIAPWRQRFPEVMRLAAFCGQRPDETKEDAA